MPALLDCLVIGGGPAGLIAATYLARYRRRLLVIDAGRSRARYIPTSHNCPGFPDGVNGRTLLARLRRQARAQGALVQRGTVSRLSRTRTGFSAATSDRRFAARTVLLATGIVDRLPPLNGLERAIVEGRVRLCPICDAHEIGARRVGLLAPAARLAGHALFLRTYSKRLLAAESGGEALSSPDRARLRHAGIDVLDGPVHPQLERDRIVLVGAREHAEVDLLYPALGAAPRASLALDLGAKTDAAGELTTDAHMATSIPGLYAAGDVVSALNQLSVAYGHAAIAATAIHRSLPRPRA